MPDTTGEAWGLELLAVDRTGRRLDAGRQRAAVGAALDAGRAAAARYAGERRPDRLAARLGVEVTWCDDAPLLGTLVRIAEYEPRPPVIRLFTRAVARIAAAAPALPVVEIYVAHELFHHLDARGEHPAATLGRATLARLGRWRWQSPVRALSEVAAHAFAQVLLGLPVFPGCLDELARDDCRSARHGPFDRGG
jgi:hypothetical protein